MEKGIGGFVQGRRLGCSFADQVVRSLLPFEIEFSITVSVFVPSNPSPALDSCPRHPTGQIAMKPSMSSVLFVLAMLASLASGQLEDLPKCGVRTSQH